MMFTKRKPEFSLSKRKKGTPKIRELSHSKHKGRD